MRRRGPPIRLIKPSEGQEFGLRQSIGWLEREAGFQIIGLRKMPTDSIRSFTDGPIERELVSFAWPILCSELLSVLDTSVNSMWVGHELGDVAFAALSNANLLWMVLFASALGVSMAGAVRIGHSLGRGDVESAKKTLGTTMSLSAVVSVLWILPMEIWTRPLLQCFGTPVESLRQAVSYLQILLLSVPMSYLYVAVMAALRAAGDSKTAFIFSGLSVAMDVALNPFLIIGLGPIPPFGIAGAALATLGSQAIGLTALVIYLYQRRHALCLYRRDVGLLCLDPRIAGLLFAQAVPMAVQFLWGPIEGMLIISLVNRFGPDTTAAYGAVMQLWNVIIMPAVALGVAVTSMVAQNIGAARWDRVRRATHLGLAYGLFVTAVLVAVAEVLDWRIFSLFLRVGSPAIVIASQINHEATWPVFIFGGYVVWVGVLRAIGVVWAPLVMSIGILVVRFPVTEALLGYWHAQAIWWSFPASAGATGALAVLHGWFSRRPLGVFGAEQTALGAQNARSS